MTGTPHPPLLLLDVLKQDTAVKELVADRVSTRSATVALPSMLVRGAGNVPILSGYSMHAPLVQVEGLCPFNWADADPEVVASRIAWAAVDAVAGIRNRIARGVVFSVRHVDGPDDDVDTTRGTGTPIYRAIVRFELTMRSLPAA